MYLERLVTILETIAQSEASDGLSVSEIVNITAFPKPSVYRQVGELVNAGLLEPRQNGRYVLGQRTHRLAGGMDDSANIKQFAIPLLQQAARMHGAAFFLSRSTGTSVEIIHAEVPQTGVSYLHPGIGPRPLHACSCGKVIAAFSDDPAIVDRMSTGLKAYTEHTKTSLVDLKTEFEKIRQRGYAECIEELEQGVCSIAVPLSFGQDDVTYSLGATGTKRVFNGDFRKLLSSVLQEICKELQLTVTRAKTASRVMSKNQ